MKRQKIVSTFPFQPNPAQPSPGLYLFNFPSHLPSPTEGIGGETIYHL